MKNYFDFRNKGANCFLLDNYFNSQNEIKVLKQQILNGLIPSTIIIGESGSGVTHLLNAICNQQSALGKNILFVNAQWLLFNTKKLKIKSDFDDFKKQLLQFDVLCIDNAQHFYKKSKIYLNFIFQVLSIAQLQNKLILMGCSDTKKDILKINRNSIVLNKIQLKELNSFDVYSTLKNLCSKEDNIPDSLIYAISSYNGCVQHHINCLISIRFNTNKKKHLSEKLSSEELDVLFDLKKYFPKQQLRKSYFQGQLEFKSMLTKHPILQKFII